MCNGAKPRADAFVADSMGSFPGPVHGVAWQGMSIRHQTAVRNPWLQLLLVVVLLGRAMVPVGYMPGQGGLELCPAYGASTEMARSGMASMDMPGMDMPSHAAHMAHLAHSAHMAHMGHAGHAGSCAYATATAATALAGGHAPPAIAWLPGMPPDVAIPAERPIPRGTIVPTRLPRGPPSLS